MATFGNLVTTVEPLATLIREHFEIHALVTEARERTEEAVASPEDAATAAEAMRLLRNLDAYMAESLVLHIAKEEEALFPALRGLGAELDQVVDEMVEQHDEVRTRRETIERTILALDHTHTEVNDERARLAGTLAGASQATPAVLETLLDGVKRLDWILQGHFGDEEDDLFVPALELLSAATWEDVDALCREIDG
jgi:DUF438 domain-containing protein